MDYIQHTWKIHPACGPLLAIPFPTGFKRQRQIAAVHFFGCLYLTFSRYPKHPWSTDHPSSPMCRDHDMKKKAVMHPGTVVMHPSHGCEQNFPSTSLKFQVKNQSNIGKKLLSQNILSQKSALVCRRAVLYNKVKWTKSSDKRTTYQTWQLSPGLFCHWIQLFCPVLFWELDPGSFLPAFVPPARRMHLSHSFHLQNKE